MPFSSFFLVPVNASRGLISREIHQLAQWHSFWLGHTPCKYWAIVALKRLPFAWPCFLCAVDACVRAAVPEAADGNAAHSYVWITTCARVA
jgi:hypothetical protein